MQFLSIQPLIEQFRARTFRDEQVGPYFVAYVVLQSLGMIGGTEQSEWGIFSGIASVAITIGGLFYLKSKNGGTFGDQFVHKWFALGWVVAVRMLLIAIPAAVAWFAVVTMFGGKRAVEPGFAFFVIAFSVALYWWLGVQFERARPVETGLEDQA